MEHSPCPLPSTKGKNGPLTSYWDLSTAKQSCHVHFNLCMVGSPTSTCSSLSGSGGTKLLRNMLRLAISPKGSAQTWWHILLVTNKLIYTNYVVFWYARNTLKSFIAGNNNLVFLNSELFLVALPSRLVESTGDIVMLMKDFASSTITSVDARHLGAILSERHGWVIVGTH